MDNTNLGNKPRIVAKRNGENAVPCRYCGYDLQKGRGKTAGSRRWRFCPICGKNIDWSSKLL